MRTSSADPFLYENLLLDVGDVVDKLGRQHGGWYSFAAESCQTASGWRSVPWPWNSFPANYNVTHFKKAGLEPPRTWAELLEHGKVLKARGNPVGITVSHSNNANTTSASVLWCHGGKVMEADGRTPPPRASPAPSRRRSGRVRIEPALRGSARIRAHPGPMTVGCRQAGPEHRHPGGVVL